ncbi:PREDICTED: RING-H2 finger protein ATL81-like [Tarenaya hassleriana]|uniref:RING-H2 finger protein ATL81-like n=1 Tax=Tarenaya hassleriana TaxID=28532 RepID=UPI00053C6999|nr:PREDICTED: RING-H2 finger protein ATL81-like [Tarenaya hassleriana]
MPMTDTSDSPPPVHVLSSAPITIALTAFFLILLLTGFFSLFLCRCFLKRLLLAWNLQQNPSGEIVGPPENPGLDPKIVRAFPAYPYSSVRDQGTECSICLSDFSDEDTVRLITACRHAFHADCIDLWFESHKTCPVCRCELESDLSSPEKSPVLPGISLVRSRSHESLHDAVVIVVQEDVEESVGNSNRNSESHERGVKGCDRR